LKGRKRQLKLATDLDFTRGNLWKLLLVGLPFILGQNGTGQCPREEANNAKEA
jgi:hypothetical protein